MMPAKPIEIVDIVPQRHLADALLGDGRAVIVNRGRLRSVVLNCPDECGSVLTVNLDPAAGRSWTLYGISGRGFSLYPSVWRTDGCRAHFIIWNSNLYVIGRDALDVPEDNSLGTRIIGALEREPASVLRLAALINEDAWHVSIACERLVLAGAIGVVRTEPEPVYARRGTNSRSRVDHRT